MAALACGAGAELTDPGEPESMAQPAAGPHQANPWPDASDDHDRLADCVRVGQGGPHGLEEPVHISRPCSSQHQLWPRHENSARPPPRLVGNADRIAERPG